MTAQKLRCVTYCRFSSDRQNETSIEDQQRLCHDRAVKEGWSVVKDFADFAINGANKDRPQYLAMQQAALRGEFDVLIMHQLSRVWRDTVEQEQTIRRLEFRGIRLISTADGYDSESKARKVHRGIKGLMNELHNDDLAANVQRGLQGQALKKFWCGGRPYGYRLKLLRDISRLDTHGEAARIGTTLEINAEQPKIVKEIFARFADGESCLTIARDLNARGVASPGSTWKRKKRLCDGWMTSAVPTILLNPLYTGKQRWNTSQFVRDPDTGKHLRRRRPQSEWVTNQIEALRIVGDGLFARAQARTRVLKDGDVRLKQGGRASKLLSGLLKCATCGRNYTIADARAYSCGGYINGGKHACSNDERARQDVLEAIIIKPIKDDLLQPARVARMAKEMEAEFERADTGQRQQGRGGAQGAGGAERPDHPAAHPAAGWRCRHEDGRDTGGH